MKRITTIILLLVMLLSFSVSPSRAQVEYAQGDGYPLQGEMLLQSAAIQCAPSVNIQMVQWHNTLGNIRIYGFQIWYGMTLGGKGDYVAILSSTSDPSTMAETNTLSKTGWDHYTDPSGISNQVLEKDFAPNYFYLPDGYYLTLHTYCVTWTNPAPIGKVQVTVYYAVVP